MNEAGAGNEAGLQPDATTFGGAEQVLANLLEALDPAYEIRVLAVDRAVGDAIASARDDTKLHLLRP